VINDTLFDLCFSKFSKRKQHSDMKIEDETATSPEESWSVYSPAEISKYISSR